MKIEKNKIVFISVLVVIVIFLVTYTLMITGEDEEHHENLRQTEIPDLEEKSHEIYDSKLEASKKFGIRMRQVFMMKRF